MSKSHKLILVAVVAVAGLFLANRLYQPESRGTEQATPLLENLNERADSLSGIHIRMHNDQTHLKKGEQGWTVAEKSHYPADTDKLRKLLRQIAQARLVEKKTARAENLPRLNLMEPGAEEGAGTLLELQFGEERVAFILGKNARAGGRMLRHADQHQAWRVKPAPTPLADPMQWVDSLLMDIDPDHWQSVRVEPAEGMGWTLARATPADRNFTLEPMPAGKTFKDEHINRSLVNALQGLRFTDVRPARDDVDLDAEASNSLFFHGWHGDRLKVKIIEEEGVTWFAFEFQAGPEPQDGADGQEDRPDLSTLDIENWNEKLTGWWYRLPDYKASQLNRSKDDLLKQVEETPAAADESGQEAVTSKAD